MEKHAAFIFKDVTTNIPTTTKTIMTTTTTLKASATDPSIIYYLIE